MAKQIIVLDTLGQDGGHISVTCCFWFPVQAGKESPIPSLNSSAFKNADAGEITALQNGTVVEEVQSYRFPSTYTVGQIQTELVLTYAARKAYLLNLPFKGQFYGKFYDGSVWA